MASFSLFASSNTPRTLTTFETGYISQNGALGTIGTAITASGSVSIAVLGSVVSTAQTGIAFAGSQLTLNVGINGTVGGLNNDAVSANSDGRIDISNAGYIFSESAALDLVSGPSGESILVTNSGVISGQSVAIRTNAASSFTWIENTGTISGGNIGMDLNSGGAFVTNLGTITGHTFGYSGGGQIDIIRNFGTISGIVDTDESDDIVTNRGTLDDVFLGGGNDRFDGRDGIVAGDVSGEDGNDTYIVSVSDISLIELADEGVDMVRSNVNFSLTQNFENLTLIGAKNINGTGNGLANHIEGNNGDNTLHGGNGADTLEGAGGDDILRGGRRNDTLDAGKGDDVLRGGADDDVLFGSDGNDLLIGGAGTDRLTGGQGSDVFQFNRAVHSPLSPDSDQILDFETGIDRIDLSNLIEGEFRFLSTGSFAGKGAAVKVFVQGGNSIVKVNVDGDSAGTADMRIVLTDVTGVQESDFIL